MLPLIIPAFLSSLKCWEIVGCARGKLIDNISTDATIYFDEILNDGDSCRMPKRLSHRINGVLLTGKMFCLCRAYDCILILQYYDKLFQISKSTLNKIEDEMVQEIQCLEPETKIFHSINFHFGHLQIL
ncbi:hypothetical protein [Arachidicoccus sp.]|uniref:hypothetical protein n=1 Tax=Arachidicoccus sp. TaxID=1872624 RepID=UPI003D1F6376